MAVEAALVAGVGIGSAATLVYGGFFGLGGLALASFLAPAKHGGHGHYGGGYGRGYGRGYGKRRRRRSARKNVNSRSGPKESSHLTFEERLLAEAHQQDVGRCGERLVCEVSASARTRHLNFLEREVLQFVRDGDRKFNAVYPGEAVTANSTILKDYKKAAALGKVGGACAERYRHCPYSAADIISRVMELIRIRPQLEALE